MAKTLERAKRSFSFGRLYSLATFFFRQKFASRE